MTQASTLIRLLQDHARRQPDRIFCQLRRHSGTQAVSYGWLLERSLRFATAYRRAGLRAGDTVSIVLGHSEDMLCAFVGALLGGGIPSYLAPPSERQDSTHYWQQLQAQCRRIGHGLLVTSPALLGLIGSAVDGSAMALVSTDQVNDTLPLAEPFDAAPGDTALLQHSSGTTGARKGVALSHRAILDQLQRYAEVLALNDKDVIVSWLPLYHDMGLISSFLLPLVTGTPLVLLDPFEWVAAPATLLAAISEHRGTLCWLPNFAFHFLARMPLPKGLQLDLSCMRAFVNCSEPCKAEAFDVFLHRFGNVGVRRSQLQICYAMAETVFAVTQTVPGTEVLPLAASRQALLAGAIVVPQDGDDTVLLMPVGTTLQGASVQVLDDTGQALPEGRVGELAISASYLFTGYHQEPALSAAALRDGWYRSGDLGAMHAGQLYITGRKKDLVIVNGKNFYVHDIEAAVNRVDGVKPGRCVAFGVFHPGTGSEVVHVVAETETDAATHTALARSIKDAVQRELGLAIAKAAVVPGKWLVKTTSGKIARGENRDKYLQAAAAVPA